MLTTRFQTVTPNIEAVPITDANVYKYYAGFTLNLTGLKVGDLVLLRGQFQVNNPNPYNVMIASAIVRGQPDGASYDSLKFPSPVFRLCGSDVAPNGHWWAERSSSDKIVQAGGRTYSLAVNAATTDPRAVGAYLIFLKDYGGLEAVVIKA